MPHTHMLAIDLGAESGRGVLGTFDGRQLRLKEVHRFTNQPVTLFGTWHWNAYELHHQITQAIAAGHQAAMDKADDGDNTPLASMGVDSWGVDFALLDKSDSVMGLPYHYRDRLTEGVMTRVLETVGRDAVFNETGIQFLPFNTLYQLVALREQRPELLQSARSLLMMGELFTFWLTGEKVSELTNASTTQLFNPTTNQWSSRLIDALDLPGEILPDVAQPGTDVGPLHPSMMEPLGGGAPGARGLRAPRIIVPAVHDTGSAVAAVPSEGDDWCYLSSGTWSLLGVELTSPLINDASAAYNFTNEAGIDGTWRFLKNVMGLWILQQSRETWAKSGQTYTYDQLTDMAGQAPPYRTLFDPDDIRFLPPGDMPGRIAAYAEQTGQPVPTSVSEFARCILESLALKYRATIEQMEEVTNRSIRVVHVVGGGSQNELLNQLTADVTKRTVVAGPVEATAMGNLLVQAMTLGLIPSHEAARQVVRQSVTLTRYEPGGSETSPTDDAASANAETAYERFKQLLDTR